MKKSNRSYYLKINISQLQNKQIKDVFKICKRNIFTKGSNSIVIDEHINYINGISLIEYRIND